MSNYLNELNDIQRAAVTHVNGPLLIVAGPGSGKTRVLTYRIAHLIETGVAPWEILTLTFTNKAAKEMKERIAKVVGEKGNKVWAGTFHSIFARILRSEAEAIGYNSNFTIYDSSDSQSVINDIIKKQGLDPKVYTAGSVLNAISLAKNNLVSPAAYATDNERLINDRHAKKPYIYKLYDMYVSQCKRSGAMDFDDLLYQMHFLLKNFPDIADKYRRRFKFMLVDEFQDTNQLQSAIVNLLVKFPQSPENICVVGDDAQSIYAFRGATIQNILEFERTYPNLKVYKLEQNYRSTSAIVEAANEVISNNRRQIKKTIFTDKLDGEPIRVVKAMTDEEEGRVVVSTVLEQKNRLHLDNNDIAILYRTNAQSRIFEEALARQRVPYRVFGGLSFFQRKEIKDLVAYLRMVVNPSDQEALKRIINYPRRGIGDTTVDKLSEMATTNNMSIWHVLQHLTPNQFPARALVPIQEFVQTIKLFAGKQQKLNAYELAEWISRESGILKDLKKDTSPEGIGRIENVQALLDGVKAFVEGNDDEYPDKSLAAYLQNIALLTDADNDKGTDDHVKLMSVHAAKGLEFRSVFVVGMEEKIFPSFMALGTGDPAALDEERRLFYVAITRAKEFLTLSFAASRYRYGKMEYNEKSRFMNEISPKLTMQTISSGSQTASVSGIGAFSKPQLRQAAPAKQDLPKDFVISPMHEIVKNAPVLHPRFGKGIVVNVEGGATKVATIKFEDASHGEKRIMLKFAQLMVIKA